MYCPEPVVTDHRTGNALAYSQEEIDDLAYAYVLICIEN